MKVLAFLAAISLSWVSFASPAFLPVPKRVGASNTPVYFAAAKAEVLKKHKNHTFYSLDVILKWGINAFEKGQLIYKCQNIRASCEMVDYRPQKSYVECRKYRNHLKCSGSPAAESSPSATSEDRDPHFEESAQPEPLEPELH